MFDSPGPSERKIDGKNRRFRKNGHHVTEGILLCQGTIVNRIYGTLKNLYIHLFLLTRFGPDYYGPP